MTVAKGRDHFMYKIPDDMHWEQATLIELLSCVLNVIERAACSNDGEKTIKADRCD